MARREHALASPHRVQLRLRSSLSVNTRSMTAWPKLTTGKRIGIAGMSAVPRRVRDVRSAADPAVATKAPAEASLRHGAGLHGQPDLRGPDRRGAVFCPARARAYRARPRSADHGHAQRTRRPRLCLRSRRHFGRTNRPRSGPDHRPAVRDRRRPSAGDHRAQGRTLGRYSGADDRQGQPQAAGGPRYRSALADPCRADRWRCRRAPRAPRPFRCRAPSPALRGPRTSPRSPMSTSPRASSVEPGNAAVRALAASLRSLVDATTAQDSALGALDSVDVSGRLVLEDRTHGTSTAFDNAELSFEKGKDGSANLSIAADGPEGRWAMGARASEAGDATKDLTVEVRDLSLDEITLAGGLREIGFDFDMPVSAKMAFHLDANGVLDKAVGNFNLGAGYFKLDDPDHEPLLVDSVAGGFHLDQQKHGIEIDRTELRAGGSDFVMSGHVDLPRSAGEPWAIRTEASGIFGAERPGEKPIKIAKSNMAFRILPSERRFAIDHVDVSGPEVSFEMSGDRADAGQRLQVAQCQHRQSHARHGAGQTLAELYRGSGPGLAAGQSERRHARSRHRDGQSDRPGPRHHAGPALGAGRPRPGRLHGVRHVARVHGRRSAADRRRRHRNGHRATPPPSRFLAEPWRRRPDASSPLPMARSRFRTPTRSQPPHWSTRMSPATSMPSRTCCRERPSSPMPMCRSTRPRSGDRSMRIWGSR